VEGSSKNFEGLWALLRGSPWRPKGASRGTIDRAGNWIRAYGRPWWHRGL